MSRWRARTPADGGEDAWLLGQRDEEFDADGFGFLGFRHDRFGVEGEDGFAGAQGLDREAFLFGAGGGGLGVGEGLAREDAERPV